MGQQPLGRLVLGLTQDGVRLPVCLAFVAQLLDAPGQALGLGQERGGQRLVHVVNEPGRLVELGQGVVHSPAPEARAPSCQDAQSWCQTSPAALALALAARVSARASAGLPRPAATALEASMLYVY
jgi:hypothetical protein